ncbi:transmembrane protein 6/97 [Sporodiniella umbellata]|nr:transmembrane protein 6/97 [Sporodiniella umbellata]
MTLGLLSRPLDLIYFIYFATHIPTTVLIDFQAFCPTQYVPQVLLDLSTFYKTTYKDPLMGSTEPLYWFLSFIAVELLIQLPFFFVACYGLMKDSKYIRLPLAVYAAHVTTTVLPTLAEVMLNPKHQLAKQERWTLFAFYFPYFILPLIMLFDSYTQVNQLISSSQQTKKALKSQ